METTTPLSDARNHNRTVGLKTRLDQTVDRALALCLEEL